LFHFYSSIKFYLVVLNNHLKSTIINAGCKYFSE